MRLHDETNRDASTFDLLPAIDLPLFIGATVSVIVFYRFSQRGRADGGWLRSWLASSSLRMSLR